MGPRRIRAGTRRRLLGAGLAVGVLVGAASGAAMFTGAAPAIGGPRPLVLHAAPALVVAERPAQLAAATFCHAPDAPSCEVVAATSFVRPAGVTGWSPVEGRFIEGAYRHCSKAERRCLQQQVLRGVSRLHVYVLLGTVGILAGSLLEASRHHEDRRRP